MKAIAGFICLGLVLPAVAQERRPEIDPNTKIEGGADVRGSGANAGAGRPESRIENNTRIEPDKKAPERDKPISERKPQERERDDEPAKGETAPQR